MFRTIAMSVPIIMVLTIVPAEMKKEDNMKIKIKNEEFKNFSQNDHKTQLQRYVEYNQWANQQFVEWLSSATEEDLNREVVSSYSSLKTTIFHIWNAEYLWLQIIKGEAADQSPVKGFEGDKTALFNGWLEASERFSRHIQTMTGEELNAEKPRSKGDGQMLVADMIQHCMNHSTYHRGQLITMGRQIGLTDPPRTDYIYYVGLQTK